MTNSKRRTHASKETEQLVFKIHNLELKGNTDSFWTTPLIVIISPPVGWLIKGNCPIRLLCHQPRHKDPYALYNQYFMFLVTYRF